MTTEQLNEFEERAKKVSTSGELIDLIKDLTDQNQSYNSIVTSLAIASYAAMRVMDLSPVGGISGFQASGVVWEFIRLANVFGSGPKAIINYNDMLFPQNEHKFDKAISIELWEHLQNEAKERLKKTAHPEVIKHWQSIVDGVVPFGYKVERVNCESK